MAYGNTRFPHRYRPKYYGIDIPAETQNVKEQCSNKANLDQTKGGMARLQSDKGLIKHHSQVKFFISFGLIIFLDS
jgi:hypothetical protein